MSNANFVAYYRVSKERQGRSGLGLDAQQKAVRDYLKQETQKLIGQFTEVESGKRDKNRPKLIEALDLCKKRKATLIIAKLDRLGRNAAFLMKLRDSGVDIRACDIPHAGTLEFGIRAVFAQHEREEIAERTRVALAAAKARGKKLGANGKALAKKNRKIAEVFARRLAPTIRRLQQEHSTLRSLTEALNAAGVKTSRNGKWHLTSVKRLLDRIGK